MDRQSADVDRFLLLAVASNHRQSLDPIPRSVANENVDECTLGERSICEPFVQNIKGSRASKALIDRGVDELGESVLGLGPYVDIPRG
jgi:hypothetical protein